MELGVDYLVQMDSQFNNYAHMRLITIPTHGMIFLNIIGLKLIIMKLDTLKLVCKKLQLIHQIGQSSLSC